MATATVLKLKKADALKLCHALGFKDVEKWTDARLTKKISQLNTVVDETTKVADKTMAALLKSVVEALDEGGDVFVVEGKAEKSTPAPTKLGKKVAKPAAVQEPEDEEVDEDEDTDSDEEVDEDEDTDSDEEVDEDETEEPEVKAPKKPAKATKPAEKATKGEKGKPVAANAGGGKKPGIIANIIAMLKKGSEKKPITKEAILEKLKEEFPEREEKAMKSTINSQVPSGLKAEKDITVKRNDKGFWIEDSKGY